MRAKFRIASVLRGEGSNETLKMHPVSKSGAYPTDGVDEDNTFARWSPSGELTLQITNPDLIGKFNPGEKFYVDFTPVEPSAAQQIVS